MDGIKGVQQVSESWWQFFDFCFNVDPASTLCETFWTRTVAGFIVLGILTVLVGIWKYFNYLREYRAALRAQWEREQADEVGIQEASWHADKAYQAELPEDEVLARIREAVEARKREIGNSPKPDGAT